MLVIQQIKVSLLLQNFKKKSKISLNKDPTATYYKIFIKFSLLNTMYFLFKHILELTVLFVTFKS